MGPLSGSLTPFSRRPLLRVPKHVLSMARDGVEISMTMTAALADANRRQASSLRLAQPTKSRRLFQLENDGNVEVERLGARFDIEGSSVISMCDEPFGQDADTLIRDANDFAKRSTGQRR